MDYLGPESDEKGLYETRSEGMEERRRRKPCEVRGRDCMRQPRNTDSHQKSEYSRKGLYTRASRKEYSPDNTLTLNSGLHSVREDLRKTL